MEESEKMMKNLEKAEMHIKFIESEIDRLERENNKVKEEIQLKEKMIEEAERKTV